MSLSDSDLDQIRAWVGPEPSDSDLRQYYAGLGDWRLVAMRVIRLRKTTALQAAASGAQEVTVPDVISVKNSSDVSKLIAAYDADYAALKALWDADQGQPVTGVATSSRLRRTVPR